MFMPCHPESAQVCKRTLAQIDRGGPRWTEVCLLALAPALCPAGSMFYATFFEFRLHLALLLACITMHK